MRTLTAMNLKPQASGGEGQLVADYGPQRFTADWDNPSHRVKRLLAEFLGVAVPGHFPELKREGTAFTAVAPQSLEIQFE